MLEGQYYESTVGVAVLREHYNIRQTVLREQHAAGWAASRW